MGARCCLRDRQEFVVACRRENQLAQRALVDADYVRVPQRDVGEIFGYYFLDFAG